MENVTHYETLKTLCSYCEEKPAGIACCDEHEDEGFCSDSCAQAWHEMVQSYWDDADLEYDRMVEDQLLKEDKLNG